jgi:hypothetical protein
MSEETQVDSSGLTSPVVIRDMGSLHVGGEMFSLQGMPFRERVGTHQWAVYPVDQNGEIIADQMYVQYVKLERPTSEWPLLLWHGGGMSGVDWETTPDGRPGWQMFFLRAGFDVYVSDAVERGCALGRPIPRSMQKRRTSEPHAKHG